MILVEYVKNDRSQGADEEANQVAASRRATKAPIIFYPLLFI